MNPPEILLALVSTSTPVLPGALLLSFALPLMWTVVLAGCVCALGAGLSHRWRLGLTVLVAAWALIPGLLSIPYWLGLAFQMPSLMTVLICAGWLVAGLTRWRPFGASPLGLDRVGLIGIALGWLLLLDTLAMLPWSLYSLGFGTAALMLVSALVVLMWALTGGNASGTASCSGLWTRGLVLTAATLALFVATRLPTGNLLDALLDPWLWVILQVVWLRRLFSPSVGQRKAG
jgi:hypothetical protein